jgi:phosphatidylserine/phosphatidylglycerophosphate/cardiolipin synthase-like enzyme
VKQKDRKSLHFSLALGLALGAGCSPSSHAAGIQAAPDATTTSSVYTSAVQILVEPSDNGSALVAAIANAKTSVHMTMYLLSDPSALRALEEQHRAGRDVKVVLNRNFVDRDGSNGDVFNELRGAGIAVAWAPAAVTLTHEKCVILDGQEAWIMTMNLDESAAKNNREYLAIDSDFADVREAEAIFEADFAGTPATVSGKLVVSPVNARAKLVALLQTAKRTIDLEGEELSDSEVVSALTKAAAEGVRIRVVLSDMAPFAAQTTAVTVLTAAGIPVVTVSRPYIHAKAIVVDGIAAYVGSENFTAASLGYNRELGVLFDAPAAVKKVDATISGDFAVGMTK